MRKSELTRSAEKRLAADRRLERLKSAVKDAGIKLTHQRLEIFRELAETEEHPDAETLFQAVQTRVPTVSLDTVYRTLWTLRDLGLVATLGPQRDALRFDANLEPHHHYVCVRCGLVRDFASDALSDLRVPSSVEDLGSIVGAHIEVRGLCARCQREAPPQKQTENDHESKPTDPSKRVLAERRHPEHRVPEERAKTQPRNRSKS